MFAKKEYEEIVDDIISQITKGIIREKHEFIEGGKKYKLLHVPVKEILKIEGMFKGNKKIFKKGVDYRQNEDFVEWLKDTPDNLTSFFVSYIFNEPSGITDVNVGSVTRTLVEAISREISLLYEKLGQVYLSGFIDTADKSALDLVVAVLGIERMPPTYAAGVVTFGRTSEPKTFDIKGERNLYNGDDEYELKNTACEITKIEGTVNNNIQYVFKRDEYVLTKNKVKFIKKPDINTTFYVDYITYEHVKIPAGTRISTYSTNRENVRIFETTEEGVIEKKDGQWLANVQVKAIEPGKYGNVYANTINVMPKPVPGVEYVINKEDIFNGLPAESDEKLRNRAKKSLEIAGKATLLSLKSAIESIEDVRCVVVEELPDVPGIVRAIVSGGREDAIIKKIEETRAAGIKVEFIRTKIVYIDVFSKVKIENISPEDEIIRDIENSIVEYVYSLGIGENVLYNKVVSAILSVKGVVDVLNLTLNDKKENIFINTDEDTEIRNREIKVKK